MQTLHGVSQDFVTHSRHFIVHSHVQRPLRTTTKTTKKQENSQRPIPQETREINNEVQEVPPPAIIEDSIAEATLSNIVIGKELVPIKRMDARKKTKLTNANSSLIQSITGIPPNNITVDCLRKFC